MGTWPGKALGTHRVVSWPLPVPGGPLPAEVNYGPGGVSFCDTQPLCSLRRYASFGREEGKDL